MAVIKLNGEKMSKRNKPKPTNNDFVVVINSLIQEIHALKNDMDTIMGAFDMYVKFKGDSDTFESHINDTIEQKKESNEVQATGQDNQVANPANPQN